MLFIAFYKGKVEAIEVAMENIMDEMEMGKLLQNMEGVGQVIATVFLGEVRNVSQFDRCC